MSGIFATMPADKSASLPQASRGSSVLIAFVTPNGCQDGLSADAFPLGRAFVQIVLIFSFMNF
jgi:hypothetical protein